MKRKSPTLLFCLAMDALGLASWMVPFLGEWSDLVWAPVSAFVFYKSFGGKTGKIGFMLDFAEEILPFTDFIPTFTLAYIYERYLKKK